MHARNRGASWMWAGNKSSPIKSKAHPGEVAQLQLPIPLHHLPQSSSSLVAGLVRLGLGLQGGQGVEWVRLLGLLETWQVFILAELRTSVTCQLSPQPCGQAPLAPRFEFLPAAKPQARTAATTLEGSDAVRLPKRCCCPRAAATLLPVLPLLLLRYCATALPAHQADREVGPWAGYLPCMHALQGVPHHHSGIVARRRCGSHICLLSDIHLQQQAQQARQAQQAWHGWMPVIQLGGRQRSLNGVDTAMLDSKLKLPRPVALHLHPH